MSHCHNPKCSFNPSAKHKHADSSAIPTTHQGVTESERLRVVSLSVSDPLERDANHVHLAAAQRLLAAHHASEQRGRPLQFPRYRQELEISMCGVAI